MAHAAAPTLTPSRARHRCREERPLIAIDFYAQMTDIIEAREAIISDDQLPLLSAAEHMMMIIGLIAMKSHDDLQCSNEMPADDAILTKLRQKHEMLPNAAAWRVRCIYE